MENNVVKQIIRSSLTIPSLDLNFAGTKDLDSRITYTRTGQATFIDANGAIQIVSANVPRFTHDPVTGASLGLLIEEARTNLIFNSGTLTGNQSITVTAIPYTVSFTGTGTIILEQVDGPMGAVDLVGTGIGESNRVSLTFTPVAGQLIVRVEDGTVTNIQLEAGGNASSYIPTSGTAVTRSADSIQITGTNFSSWYNQIEGTIVVSASSRVSEISPSATVYSIDNNTSANSISLVYSFGSSRVEGRVNTNNSSEANIQYSISGKTFTSAFSYKMNQFDLSVGGGNNSIDRAGNLTTLDRLRLGFTATGDDALNGSIARLRYYRQALPNKLSTLSI
jgi:hypothetical protein